MVGAVLTTMQSLNFDVNDWEWTFSKGNEEVRMQEYDPWED